MTTSELAPERRGNKNFQSFNEQNLWLVMSHAGGGRMLASTRTTGGDDEWTFHQFCERIRGKVARKLVWNLNFTLESPLQNSTIPQSDVIARSITTQPLRLPLSKLPIFTARWFVAFNSTRWREMGKLCSMRAREKKRFWSGGVDEWVMTGYQNDAECSPLERLCTAQKNFSTLWVAMGNYVTQRLPGNEHWISVCRPLNARSTYTTDERTLERVFAPLRVARDRIISVKIALKCEIISLSIETLIPLISDSCLSRTHVMFADDVLPIDKLKLIRSRHERCFFKNISAAACFLPDKWLARERGFGDMHASARIYAARIVKWFFFRRKNFFMVNSRENPPTRLTFDAVNWKIRKPLNGFIDFSRCLSGWRGWSGGMVTWKGFSAWHFVGVFSVKTFLSNKIQFLPTIQLQTSQAPTPLENPRLEATKLRNIFYSKLIGMENLPAVECGGGRRIIKRH